MRRLLVLVAVGATALAWVLSGATTAPPSGATSATHVRTELGPNTLDQPGGLAVDGAGDLFIADTGHCRVLVLPARTRLLDGLHLRAGQVTTLAGGTCAGSHSLGHPTGVAVDAAGDVFIAEATAQRVQEVRATAATAGSSDTAASASAAASAAASRPVPVTVAGDGEAGFNGDGLAGTASELDEPTGVAVDRAGDLFIADTANCRVRVLPERNTTILGQAVTAGHLFTVAGTGVCGTSGQGGPIATAQIWNPVAVAVDSSAADDLLVADQGDQSVLLASSAGGTFWGTAVAAGDLDVVVGGTGDYGPYVEDGLTATGPTAELNDPRGLAVGPTGALLVTDGFMQAIRVVPAVSSTLFGRSMTAGDLYTAAGALTVKNATGLGNATKWVLAKMDTPTGVAVSDAGVVYYSDAGLSTVREIGASP